MALRRLLTYSITYFGAGLLSTAAVVAFVPQALPPAAANHASSTCLDSEEGAIAAHQIDSYTWTSRGTQSNSWVILNDDVHCQHISSIYVWNGSGGFEFGYVIGYSNCPGYRGTFYQNPKPFYWAVDSGGGHISCRVWTGRNLPQATYEVFRASDTNANYYWGPWLNGEELLPSGVLTDFRSGKNGFGMERGNPGDNGYSRFNELNEYHDSNGWSRFDDLRLMVDNDPKYKYDEINSYTGRTILQ
jgi:hypothetical protein